MLGTIVIAVLFVIGCLVYSYQKTALLLLILAKKLYETREQLKALYNETR